MSRQAGLLSRYQLVNWYCLGIQDLLLGSPAAVPASIPLVCTMRHLHYSLGHTLVLLGHWLLAMHGSHVMSRLLGQSLRWSTPVGSGTAQMVLQVSCLG